MVWLAQGDVVTVSKETFTLAGGGRVLAARTQVHSHPGAVMLCVLPLCQIGSPELQSQYGKPTLRNERIPAKDSLPPRL